MTCRICPSEMRLSSSSTPAWNWSAVNGPEMSTPCSSMISPTVSRISSSTSTRPLSSGFQRSLTFFSPPGTFSLFQASTPKIPCHG